MARIDRPFLPRAVLDEQVRLNLFPDVTPTGRVDWTVVRGPASYTCGGPLIGESGGDFILAVEEQSVCGRVRSAIHGMFSIQSRGEDLWEILQMDTTYQPLDLDDTVSTEPRPVGVDPALFTMPRDEGSDPVVDIMVVYTPSARVAVGGTDAMRALIHLATDDSNRIFSNSMMRTRISLVHIQELSYDAHENAGTDLSRISNPNDGYMDDVHSYRDIYGADIVGLIPDGLSAGQSILPGRFFVVHHDYVNDPNYTFIHEMGHNFGCRHEGGHYFLGTGGGDYHTVMRYLPGTAIPHFSNPDVFYDGVPTGTSSSNHNAQVLDAAAPAVAATLPHRTLYVLPYEAFSPTGVRGGAFDPTGQVYTLVNPTASNLVWSAQRLANWLTVSPSNGTIAAAASTTVAVAIGPSANVLPPGIYSSAVAFSNAVDGSIQSRTVVLTVSEAGTLPFIEDFESGAWSNYWRVAGTGSFRAEMTGGIYRPPVSGTNNLHLDSKTEFNPARNEVTLNLDLDRCSNVVLRFWAKGPLELYSGPPSIPFEVGADYDGVAISTNGVTWYACMALKDLGNDFVEFSTNLDLAAARYGLQYSSSFRIRFNQYGDRTRSNGGGITIDYLTVTGTSAPALSLLLPPRVLEGQGLLTNVGTVVRTGPLDSNVLVSLSNTLPTTLEVPLDVEILAGQTSATFAVTVLDDQILNCTRTAVITASGAALKHGQAFVEVVDNDTTTLAVELPDHGTEGSDETPTGIVSIPFAATVDVPILLTSSMPAELTVPASVALPAGQTSTIFTVNVINDLRIDGSQTVTVWAAAADWTSGFDSIEIEDNEHTNLMLAVPALAVEGNGVLSNAGRVAISGTRPTALPVALSSLDSSEVTVPTSVVISAGATSALFHVTIVDDGDIDGRQTNQIIATATGFGSASASLVVADNDDLHHFAWNPISNATRGAAFDVRIEARNADDSLITAFAETAALSCSNSSGPLALLPTATTSFAAGIWTGQVTVMAVSSNAALRALHAGGSFGDSAAFDALGPVAQISWGLLTNLSVCVGSTRACFVTVSNSGNRDFLFTVPDPLAFPASGLVLHYGFDTNEGATVTDLSGMNNTGHVAGASFTSTGRTGNAYAFNGSSSITASNSLSLVPAEVSLSLWVRPSIDMTGSTTYNIFNKYNSTFDRGYRLRRCYVPFMGKGTSFDANCSSSASSQNLLKDRWYHFAASRSLNTLRLYVDGLLMTNVWYGCALTPDTIPLSVGSSWQGIIDEVRVYNRPLEAYEVAILGDEGSGRKWLSVAPAAETLSPGASTNLVFTLDPAGFAVGDRREVVARILGNDLVSPVSTARMGMVVLPATPVLDPEPPFTLGDSNAVNWSTDARTHAYWSESALATNAAALANSGWTATNFFVFTNLADETIYFYRVKASSTNAAGRTEGIWSDWIRSMQLSPPGDPDKDGIPNDWEVEHGLDPTNSADAFADPDQDTFPNWQEWGADTDPTDGNDFFRIGAMDSLEPGRIFFNCSTRRTYSLYINTNLLAGSWYEVPGQTNIIGVPGGTMHLDHTNANTRRYYRVKVSPP